MYIPGRLRTGSRPSRTVMSLAVYVATVVQRAEFGPALQFKIQDSHATRSDLRRECVCILHFALHETGLVALPPEPDVAGRLLVGGVVWLAAVVLFAATLQWSAQTRPRPHRAATSTLARLLDRGMGTSRHPSWAVTNATGAHHALIVEVEADDATRALEIAPDIVAPVHAIYEEILIYVRQQGASDKLAARRVQWTAHGGYVELVIP